MATTGSITLCPGGASALLALGQEWEVPHSRRLLDLTDCMYVRTQYEGGAGQAGIRVDFSTDQGTTWQELVPVGPPFAANVMETTQWVLVPPAALAGGDVLLRAVSVATVGLTVNLYYVELQYR